MDRGTRIQGREMKMKEKQNERSVWTDGMKSVLHDFQSAVNYCNKSNLANIIQRDPRMHTKLEIKK